MWLLERNIIMHDSLLSARPIEGARETGSKEELEEEPEPQSAAAAAARRRAPGRPDGSASDVRRPVERRACAPRSPRCPELRSERGTTARPGAMVSSHCRPLPTSKSGGAPARQVCALASTFRPEPIPISGNRELLSRLRVLVSSSRARGP